MGGRSELEEFLQAQVAEGSRDSSGKFTLDRDKALEKLAAFQLPRDTAWVLKIVQAAVASGSTSLVIQQTGSDTEFYFDPREPWTLETIEAAFFQPETETLPGLDYLKRGLWSVSLNGMRPFQCAPDQATESLVWSGREFHRVSCQAGASFALTVSHRTVFQGKGLPVLRTIEAAQSNAGILLELSTYAFTCSIPLKVDGRRLDALQGCKTHGHAEETQAVALLWAEAEAPPLIIPPATFEKFAGRPGDARLAQMLQPAPTASPTTAAACLIAIQVKKATEGRQTVWKPQDRPSYLYWVVDGVVVACHNLTELPPSPVSCAVFASAAGLTSDISGFGLADTEPLWQRRRRICKSLEPAVMGANLSLEVLTQQAKTTGKVVGGALTIIGGLATLATGPQGLLVAGFGAYSFLTAGQTETQLEAQLRQKLEALKALWPLLGQNSR